VPFPSAVAAVIAAAASAANQDDEDADEDEASEEEGPDEKDLEYLSKWVNADYLVIANVAQIREKMEVGKCKKCC